MTTNIEKTYIVNVIVSVVGPLHSFSSSLLISKSPHRYNKEISLSETLLTSKSWSALAIVKSKTTLVMTINIAILY